METDWEIYNRNEYSVNPIIQITNLYTDNTICAD